MQRLVKAAGGTSLLLCHCARQVGFGYGARQVGVDEVPHLESDLTVHAAIQGEEDARCSWQHVRVCAIQKELQHRHTALQQMRAAA